ncbi:hypothetical protein CKO28_22435 [Rhodovibrio sodomensis]|uniref:Uncharacterized protein n=1 Tax=Rhodovibrio sodomensis TaxID=1088 RepID=A0ABS1DJY1_9PROT|nr:hypothetical protein [Rhodovibrio sodomensis]MBK1670779.1 hypothetical protein [Rhodovibrio sodomensis]
MAEEPPQRPFRVTLTKPLGKGTLAFTTDVHAYGEQEAFRKATTLYHEAVRDLGEAPVDWKFAFEDAQIRAT